ncbi:MAG: ATP-binding cassette domain-containing protein [Deltaproteobacteria bacterium]|nr:ATP-binding cassette domain-containing protein [Deltaproteobacteria bacterium]
MFSPVLRRLIKYLLPYKKRFLLALLAMALYGATDGAIPFLIKTILDDIFASQKQGLLMSLALVLVAFSVARGVFGFLQQYLATAVGLDIIKDLRSDINSHLLKLSPSFFSKHTTGSLISRVTNDALLARMALTDAGASLLRDSVRILVLLCASIYLDPILAAVTLIGFPLAIFPVIRLGKKVRRFSKTGQNEFGGLTGLLQELIVGHKVVQSFGMQSYEEARFGTENEKLTKTLKAAEKYAALSQPINETVASFAIAGVILYGGFSVISGVRTQGDFIAFITSMFLLYEPVKKLSRVNNMLQAGIAAAERIFEILDIEPEIKDGPEAEELARGAVLRVDYENVYFSYGVSSGSDGVQRNWVLRGVNFVVEAGETLALVGMSGGGKTTLVNLLSRYYDPTRGSIKIAGVDIRKLKLASLRKMVSVVDQHTFLFNDTVFNNIAYGCLGADVDRVYAAARDANAHEFIAKLPKGYDTIIGEQGMMLSGGQRQRVAIARALLKDAPILILDEATAALDSESEQLVQSAIERLMEGRTVLVIAHRLSTIRQADKVAVIADGELVEFGCHKDLIAAKGRYAKLYDMQFRNIEFSGNNNIT